MSINFLNDFLKDIGKTLVNQWKAVILALVVFMEWHENMIKNV